MRERRPQIYQQRGRSPFLTSVTAMTTTQSYDAAVSSESFELRNVNYTGAMTGSETIRLFKYVILYVAVALGIPGNILSAIVWLRRHVASKNSSTVYLAALAINDLVYLLYDCLHEHVSHIFVLHRHLPYYLIICPSMFESLLVLSFSTERLIAIVRPLQVCRISVLNKFVNPRPVAHCVVRWPSG